MNEVEFRSDEMTGIEYSLFLTVSEPGLSGLTSMLGFIASRSTTEILPAELLAQPMSVIHQLFTKASNAARPASLAAIAKVLDEQTATEDEEFFENSRDEELTM
ncbi:MAG: hypothetical protein V7638_3853 [Acidobacteriota bacterium]|jgi:hypothetical protein